MMLVGFIYGIWASVIIFSIMALLLNLLPAPSLTQCAAHNNVYRCELVAVPVKP